MWFIEHENLSGGRREWIKPGSQRLYGRTTKSSDKDARSEKQVFLDSKSISRKHMLLKVLEVPSGAGTKLHTKSQLEVTDLSCKATTVVGVDGTRVLKSTKDEDGNIVNDSMILTGMEYTVRLSQAYSPFKITWRPTVITYAAKPPKDLRAHSEARSAQLHAFDIKTSSEYVYNMTTHVVSEKRNLPKALCGLVSGAHIVTDKYIDAVLDAATSPNNQPDTYLPSRLEEDFDTFWPKEKEYITPPGAEPVLREASMLEPNPARSEVFKGLTFIFLTEKQHGSLQSPISGGGGKCLFYNLELGKTQPDDYVEFVKNAAGEKRRSKAGTDRLPVITVRISEPDPGMEEWEFNFRTSVEQKLHQRQIVQNEFLDAILMNDASVLNKPPSEISGIPSNMTVATKSTLSLQEPITVARSTSPPKLAEAALGAAEEPVKANPRKRPLRRGLATSRFTGFDDYEPPTKMRKIEATQTDTQMEDMRELAPAPAQDSYPISQARSQARSQIATQTAHRHSPTPEDTVESADQMNELFPVAAAMRSRRAATRAASQSVEPESHPTTTSKKKQAAEVLEKLQKAKKKAASKEIDVKERLQTRVKLEEEKRLADEENLQQLLEGVDISEIRGLAQIEEMEIIPRTDRLVQQRSEVHGEGWNDDWNGRKNFKKFRRRGIEQAPRAPKVIVPYEEVPQKKGFGGSDVFFLEAETQTSIRSSKGQKKGRKGRQDSSDDDDTGFTRRKRNTQQDVVVVEDSADEDADPIVTGTALSNRASGRVAETQVDDTQAQTQTRTQTGGRKRAAPVAVAVGQPASKRRVISRRDESSDDEDTGFRFKRRT